MIFETAYRFRESKVDSLVFASPTVVGSVRHRRLIVQQLPRASLILEPVGRNSAPAIAAACLAARSNDLLLILPADHNIADIVAFHRAIASAAKAAEEGAIVTFGVQPTFPATDYGYIQAEVRDAFVLNVTSFVEKPDFATAQLYVESGAYYWNAGIFMFRADVMLNALSDHALDVLSCVADALRRNSEGSVDLVPNIFARSPDISIDYAVMEYAENVRVVPVEMGWSDVGDYKALYELKRSESDDIVAAGAVLTSNSKNCLVLSEGPTIALSGVENLNIIATETSVLIAPMGDSSSVKHLGSRVNVAGDSLIASDQTISSAKEWLFDALSVWSNKAWDDDKGGGVECLKLDGEPNWSADRRIRVQARQIFSFAKALDLGWGKVDKGKELVRRGLDYLESDARRPDGGWAHRMSREGVIVDDTGDLYDLAFVILCGSAAYKFAGAAAGLKLARDALNFADMHLKDDVYGGWLENTSSGRGDQRRANPHMHMLEAMLALYDATGDPGALDRATECVELFEAHFFDPKRSIMMEFFSHDWSVLGDPDKAIFEPGHHYEWATLLNLYDRVAGRDTRSWRKRLVQHADAAGINPQTGFAYNAVMANGHVANSSSRSWPQMERFRTFLINSDLTNHRCVNDIFSSLRSRYLDWGPLGCWLDEIDVDGRPVSTTVPASILYHLVTAFSPLFGKS